MKAIKLEPKNIPLYRAYIELILGAHAIKSARYWYKGQQNCDLVIVRNQTQILLSASGGVRFRMNLGWPARGNPTAKLTVFGWLHELLEPETVVLSILEHMAKEVHAHRKHRQQVEAAAQALGQAPEPYTEPLGLMFSVKTEEAQLDPRDEIDAVSSETNFQHALQMRWYHKDFVNFCREHGVKCYYRFAAE